MRIVSWNVNGIRAGMRKGLAEKIPQFEADIIGVQETKANPDQVFEACEKINGYHKYCSSAQRPGYSGVALFTKEEPQKIITDIGIEQFDREGRIIAAYFKDFLLVNVYFPNGSGNGDNSRVSYKLDFYDALFDFFASHSGPMLVMGDFNTAHKEIDLARPKENQKSSGFLPEEREKFSEVLERGFVDTFRYFNKEPGQYSWWNMRTRARDRNVGWRIDGVLANNQAMAMVKGAFIWQHVMGSDHCPVGVDL